MDRAPAMLAASSGGFSLANLRAYLDERFPVPVTLMLSLALGAAAYAAAQGAFVRAGAPLVIDAAAIGGCAMTFLFAFLLRVYDEHKDFAHDAATRPDRPVQRGLITLAQLRVLGGIAVAGQLALALPYGAVPAVAYAAVLGYSVLMYVEFFAKQWLEPRFVLYALSHTAVMSILALALGVRFTTQAGASIPVELWGLLVLCAPAFFSIDVLRKIWAPATEVDGVPSYSKLCGYGGAAALGIGLLVIDAIIAGWIGVRFGGGIGWIATCAAVTAWAASECVMFARAPVAGREKRLEVAAGVHLLVMFAGIAVVAGVSNGVQWGM